MCERKNNRKEIHLQLGLRAKLLKPQPFRDFQFLWTG